MALSVKPGMYDRMVSFYQPSTTRDANTNEAIKTFANWGTEYCYLNQRINNEQFDLEKRQDVKRITIDIRYAAKPDDLDNTWQIEFESSRYHIISHIEAIEFGRQNVYRIMAERKI